MKTPCITLILALALGGCSKEPKTPKLPATDEVLSQYQTIHIGSQKLTLPTIALLSSTTHSSLALRDGTQVPMERVLSQSLGGTSVSQIRVDTSAYRTLQDYELDRHVRVPTTFCTRLLARWEQDLCAQGLYDGKEPFYPQQFQVVERSRLIGSDVQLFAIGGGGPSAGESARRLLAQATETLVACIPTQHPLCIAVLPVRGDLVVVWATQREAFEADTKRISWIMEQYLGR